MVKKRKKIESNDTCSFDRDYLLEKALKCLGNKKYTWVSEVGSGTFGDVIAIKKKSDPEVIAAKLQHKKFTSPGELYLWPCLKHPNILPLLGRFHYDNVDIFITPLLSDNLSQVLKKRDFREHPVLFHMTIDWIKDVITGLEYLHFYGVCHLDLKGDNELISSEMKAVISDFGGIQETKDTVNRYLLPIYYAPPETWTNDEVRPSVDGEKYDIWATGLLIFNCFTDRWADSHFFERDNWKTNVFPLIYKCLQEEFFSSLLKQGYPSCQISKEECHLALNLMQGVLRHSPHKRPTCAEILDHPLISGKNWDENVLQPDEIWIISKSDIEEPKTSDKQQEIMQFPEAQLEIADIYKITADFELESESSDSETKIIETYSSQKIPEEEPVNFQYEDFHQPGLCTYIDGENTKSKMCSLSQDVANFDPDQSDEIITKKQSKTKKIQKRIQAIFSRFKQFFTKKK